MRVLFTSTPGWGHVHPMVPLARAFLDRGDEVLWATAGPVCDRLRKAGFEATPCGLSEGDTMALFQRWLPEVEHLAPSERPAFMFTKVFGTVRTGPMLADLIPLSERWKPEVLVCDAAELAGPIAAAVLGVPNVTHSFGPLLPAVRLETAGAEVAPLWRENGLEPAPHAGCYRHLYIDIYPPGLQADTEHPHIAATQHLSPVGFVTAGEEALPELLTAPSSTPLIYITFGTVFTNDTVLSSVVEAVRELPVRVVVTVGPRGDPGSLGPQPDNVHVARYIAHNEVLARCSAVVSHAGSGTFLAALAAGLPQLCLPQGADQFLNAAACVRSGSGLAIEPGTVAVNEVRDAVHRLLSEPGFREAAERVSGEIEAMPSPSGVADRLHADYA